MHKLRIKEGKRSLLVSGVLMALQNEGFSKTYIHLTNTLSNHLVEIKGSQTTPLMELEMHGPGKYPYVTTQATNNGVGGFYNFHTEDGDCLTADSAVVGYCAYQREKFSASDHVEVLRPLFEMNQYIALFLTTVLNLERC